MDYENILKVAAAINDRSPGADRLDNELAARLVLASMTEHECVAVAIASKLLEGESYAISSDNLATWHWVRELAAFMGAMVTEVPSSWPPGTTTLLIKPSSKQ